MRKTLILFGEAFKKKAGEDEGFQYVIYVEEAEGDIVPLGEETFIFKLLDFLNQHGCGVIRGAVLGSKGGIWRKKFIGRKRQPPLDRSQERRLSWNCE